MKRIYFYLLLGVVTIASAQKRVNLKTFAPVNPQPYERALPLPAEDAGEVKAIDHFWQQGKLRYTVFYDDKGNVDRVFEPGVNKNYVDQLKIFRNGKGHITEVRDVDRDGKEIQETYSYDDKGNLVSKTVFKSKPVRKGVYNMVADKVTIYEYDDLGRVIKMGDNFYSYKIDGDELVMTSTSTYGGEMIKRYNEYGDQTFYEYSSQNSKPTAYSYEHIRDSKVRVTAIRFMDNEFKDVKRYHYTDGTVSADPMNQIELQWSLDDQSLKWNGYTNDLGRSQGFYKNGKLEGPGQFQGYGVKQAGNFSKGLLNGPGFIKDLTQSEAYTVGHFKNGKLDGYGIKILDKIPVEAGIYKNGVLSKSYDLTTALNDHQACTTDTCPDGFQQRKTSNYMTKSYAFYKDGKPQGVMVEVGMDDIAAAYFDQTGAIFYAGRNQNYYILANYNSMGLNGLGYLAQGANFQAGVFENNTLKEDLSK